jgi:hypothetical protein
VDIAIAVTRAVRQRYPGGLPTDELRSVDEPLLGQPGDEAPERDPAPEPR